jgi:hypothetical protein
MHCDSQGVLRNGMPTSRHSNLTKAGHEAPRQQGGFKVELTYWGGMNRTIFSHNPHPPLGGSL